MKRNQNFGGCELSSILQPRNGVNMEKAVNRKVEGFKFGGMNFFFGEIFESVICNFIFKKVKIHKIKRIPHDYLPVVISTDGVYVSGEDLIMVEIKCPFKRKPYKKLPYYHTPQMQAGLNITGCDEGVFIDARIRRCSLYDLNYTKYHQNDDNLVHKKPIGIGCIMFYKKGLLPPIDFGMANDRLLLSLREEIRSGSVKKKYINIKKSRFPVKRTIYLNHN